MRYRLNEETQPKVAELCHLIGETRRRLGCLSWEARAEWDHVRCRFPSAEDVGQGFISLSELELAEVRTIVRRFHDLVVRAEPLATGDSSGLRPASQRKSVAAL
ncbi:MAG TPA: hypothetical protein VGP07_15210 [Polyangia bacterium]|jgi:hypothetical protein